MSFDVGSLVRVRGREWVVLPDSKDDYLILRPLGGTDAESTGVYVPLEPVEPARFAPPDPSQVGDHRSSRLLRDAVRLSSRASAGPFRSFGRIAVEPRPYQLVPLLMALRLDPVRLLIADDVGIGKTIEACLIARELLDRGEVERLAVLCPPHLAEQWQEELDRKFHLECELVLPSTVKRLERRCGVGESLFDVYPHVVVSTDFIKSERHRHEFLRSCPELVIVDEAHSCALPFGGRGGGRHLRHELLKGLAAAPARHLVLVTATPHSGKEEAFRSLLTLLKPSFADLPADLSGRENEARRRELAAHFVQRRRADIRDYLDASTKFPVAEEKEETYKLSPKYQKLFERVLRHARAIVRDPEGGEHRRRVRWWAALGLLRALGSSPAAAAMALRNRASAADTASLEEADEVGSRSVLDLDPDETLDGSDVTPGADPDAAPDPGADPQDSAEPSARNSSARRQLLAMAREAEALSGGADEKVKKAAKLVADLLAGGFRPIVFCRFIATAEYVVEELRNVLPKDVEIAAVTGTLPPADRAERVAELAKAERRVLVATDCLSEGINLQDHFDAVFHYDLSWNPTRHEQRQGRVDRYGQPREKVRVLTFYGVDNRIDGIVLDVLLRKHRTIRSSLGISVPVPVDPKAVIDAIFEGLLLREEAGKTEEGLQQLLFFEDFFRPDRERIHQEWESVAEKEKRSRTLFAQHTIRVDEVAAELAAARKAVGSSLDCARFLGEVVRMSGGTVATDGLTRFDLSGVPRALLDAVGVFQEKSFAARFELPVEDGVLYLSRTHPIVEGAASYVLEGALEGDGSAVARRAGAIRTRRVARRTTLLVLRYRYHIRTRLAGREDERLAEDTGVLAFEGPPEIPVWLDESAAEALLDAAPDDNVHPEQAADFARKVIDRLEDLRPRIEESARERAAELRAAHERVRAASARSRRGEESVDPHLPVDLLGVYVFLPALGPKST
jgi:superfamily II DNA or RNA helicase